MTRTRSRRNDAAIFADGRRALDDSPGVPGTIRIHVFKGIAILTGGARMTAERDEAENAVRHVDGVCRLVNAIIVAGMPDAELVSFTLRGRPLPRPQPFAGPPGRTRAGRD
jgi:hypothetical protein